ncbi:hypothetical protein [Microscilla marina]|uniref:Lipoprotein, putative n=1 Tax=Microscilla marina ATCC 23134 TaxID=313606 RepID=A1ZQZ5_MICM2|nr:hypothetical protein [Microscilla marina]EAY27300.1 lipoprotein, putative [Microscilla marina ATCC 23134]
MFRRSTFILLSAFAVFACNQVNEKETSEAENNKKQIIKDKSTQCITSAEVVAAQQQWGAGIVKIGKVFNDGGDYKQAAKAHIESLYGYDLGMVLFKPTLASEDQFRETFDAALSYFVGGNETYAEDKGFAIAPYTKVRWENSGIYANVCDMAIAMGNYYFTTKSGKEIKVEYTFGYVKDKNGKLRIVAHKSALPYNPG